MQEYTSNSNGVDTIAMTSTFIKKTPPQVFSFEFCMFLALYITKTKNRAQKSKLLFFNQHFKVTCSFYRNKLFYHHFEVTCSL